MDIGKLNKRIKVLEYQEHKNDEGVYIKDWVELCKIWAYVKPLSGKEVYTAQADEHKASVKVNIRYNKNINEFMRVQIYDEVYDIGYIEDVDLAHKEMWLTLEKVI